MKLKNPPIVEAWIDFRFEIDENAERWQAEKAIHIAEQMYDGEFDTKVGIAQEVIVNSADLNAGRPGERRRYFDAIRVFNERGDKYLLIGQARAAYAVTKVADAPWEGFVKLRDQALDCLTKFQATARPGPAKSVALHYVDDVRVSNTPGVEMNLANFLMVRPQIPHAGFGPVSQFALELVFPTPGSPEQTMVLQMRSMPLEESSGGQVAFRMDWHHSWDTTTIPDLDAIKMFLDRAHDRQTASFHHAFTQTAWDSFGPEDRQ